MRKKICLIMDATEGVGRATATQLAKQGFTLIMAVWNGREIAESTGNADVTHITTLKITIDELLMP